MHCAFRHRRVRGEWFRLTSEEVGLIESVPAAALEADLPAAVIALHRANQTKRPRETSKIVAGFGAAVRAERTRLGLTGAELAKRAGTTPAAVSDIERAARGVSLDLAARLAAALGASLDDLIAARSPRRR